MLNYIMKKILLIITALIVVVIIAAIAFIKIYITPERVKAFVVPAAESALNRKVDIGEIDINIFTGIGLKDFAIKEADKKNDFIKCKEFVLRFKLLPLLTKQVVIDEIKLVSPEVSIWRDKEGKFNFEDIGKKEGTVEAKSAEEGEASGALPISLLVDSIVISDAKFSLVDLKKELPDLKTTTDIKISIKSVGTSEISTKGNIDLVLDEIIMRGPEEGLIRDLKAALEYDIRVNLDTLDIQIEKADLEFQEIPLSISGSVSSLKEQTELDLHLTLPSLKIAKVQEVLSLFVDVGGIGLSGGLSADMKLKGKPGKLESMKIIGNIVLAKVGVAYEDINAQIDGEIKFSEELMNVRINAAVGRNKAELKGSIRNYFKDQDIKMDLYAKKLFIDELMPAKAAGPDAASGKSEP
ncbi:MAG TPA: AsmA family protein, partial [Nitrospirae bacterium]|nr:AsmA family protein [Nitrospirota bacterium]HEW80892.1 AsmA family protein [Nitrospirota bacterium]